MTTTSRTVPPNRPDQHVGSFSRACAGLVALAVLLVAAFLFAPRPLAGRWSGGGGVRDQRDLVERLSVAFADSWSSGGRKLSPDMERLVHFWLHYHVVKAVAAALLLIVLYALAVLLWKTFLRADGRGAGARAALASAGTAASALALFALATVMANVQGALAPFASLLSLLPVHAPSAELAAVLDQVAQRLADHPENGDATPPVLGMMIGDFARYHAVMAAAAVTVALLLVGTGTRAWKRSAVPAASAASAVSAVSAASDRRARRVFRSFGLLSALPAAAFLVVAAANTGTAADPAPALLAFFDGGW